MVAKSKVCFIVCFMLLLTLGASVITFFIGKKMTLEDSVTYYLLTEDVQRGHSLEGKYKEVTVSSDAAISLDNAVVNQKDIEGCIALHDMYRHSPITKADIGSTQHDLERNLEFSLPTEVGGTVANSVLINDRVALLVKFDDERSSAVVVPDVTVKDLRTSNGASLTPDSNEPGFYIFNVNSDELRDLDDASKEGTIYAVRYVDLSQELLSKTYVKGKAPATSKDADNNGDNSANSKSNTNDAHTTR